MKDSILLKFIYLLKSKKTHKQIEKELNLPDF